MFENMGDLPRGDDLRMFDASTDAMDLEHMESGSVDFDNIMSPIETSLRFDETDNASSQGSCKIDDTISTIIGAIKRSVVSGKTPDMVVSDIKNLGSAFKRDLFHDDVFMLQVRPLYALAGVLGRVFISPSLFGDCKRTATELKNLKVKPRMALKKEACEGCQKNKNCVCSELGVELVDKDRLATELKTELENQAKNYPEARYGSFKTNVLAGKDSVVSKIRKFAFAKVLPVAEASVYSDPKENLGFDSPVQKEAPKVSAKTAVASIVREITASEKFDREKITMLVKKASEQVGSSGLFSSYSTFMKNVLEKVAGFGLKASWLGCPTKVSTIEQSLSLSNGLVNPKNLGKLIIVPDKKCKSCSFASNHKCLAYDLKFSSNLNVEKKLEEFSDKVGQKIVNTIEGLKSGVDHGIVKEADKSIDILSEVSKFEIDDRNKKF